MLMQIFIKTIICVTAATATSLPIKSRAITSPFRLRANVKGFDLTPSLQGQELSYTPNADCIADITFAPAGQGSLFYTTGDTVKVFHFSDDSSPSAGLIVTPGGTATVPSLNIVQLQCQAGTTGVTVTTEGLQYQGGAWMACFRDGAIVLSFKQAGQRTLLGCADVEVLPI
ncbi:uncharacterized protein CTRU02_203893 [Colletotrichum truncatum]|uniref:Uncharacterized protein n=1 Tax=Colletotrichum truncatum TaxID=5467 RepID=A0ACC3ZAW5_COLTU|nr:uncharacterized protein CTRU02_04226 [Colletotrichum truncatum]KAF6796265.1 hypothetical protein CTRU02_04226 [Colletotrichum truncatum]